MAIPFSYNDFHGGLNTRDTPYLLTDDESRDLLNVVGQTTGAITKRNGLVTYATTPVTLTSLASAEAIASPCLIGMGGTGIYKIVAGTVTSIGGAVFTNNLRWEVVNAPVAGGQGPIYMMNGSNTPQQWSGTGSTANWTNATGSVSVPNGKYCLYTNNQVFVAGVSSTPSRVYWSAIGDPTNWDPDSLLGAGWVDLDPNDGEAITALGRVGPYVLVGKPRKLWVILDSGSAANRQISSNVGVVAHRSLAAAPEGTYFLAEDRGVYLTNGTKLTPISDKIQPTIDSIASPQRMNACGAFINAHYYLSVSTGGTHNDVLLDWDTVLQSWWKHSVGSNQFALYHATNVAQLFSAKATGTTVDQCFVPNVWVDNGQQFQWFWRGPWQSPSFYRRRRFPTPYFRKRLQQFRADGTGQIDFSLAQDFVGAEAMITPDLFGFTDAEAGGLFGGVGIFGDTDGTTFGGRVGVQRAREYSLGVADAFSIVFSCTSPNPAQVTSYTLFIHDRRDLMVS